MRRRLGAAPLDKEEPRERRKAEVLLRRILLLRSRVNKGSERAGALRSPRSLTHLALKLSVSRLPPLVYANLTGCDLGRVRHQGGQTLLQKLSCPNRRLFLSRLILKDAG
jgi:hypothetical protein